MALKVITDDNCGCGTDGQVGIEPNVNPVDSIIVRSKPGITIGNIINEFNENGKKVYELDDLVLVKPQITFTSDSGVVEVGSTIALVTFNGLIEEGTYPIASRSITPDPGGLDLTAAFSFQKTNVYRSTPGIGQSHTVQVIDEEGNITTVVAGVPFKDAFYQGFSGLASLDQTAIKALANKVLVDSILAQYGGQKSYVVPNATPKYIYWCGTGTPPASAILNGLPLPFFNHADVVVTNPNDGALTKTYWVRRTANRLNPGTYLITLL